MSYRIPGISEPDLQQTMGVTSRNRGMYMPGMFSGQDQFTGSQPKQEFSLLRAAGKFFQGAVVDTITGLFSVKGLAMMAGAGLICAAGGAPLVLAAGLGLGGFQLLKGTFGAVSNYASGNYAQAEESFRDIGGGTVAVVGAAAGIRARYAAAEGVGGKLNALWGDIRGKSSYTLPDGSVGNMYKLMGQRGKMGWNAVYEVVSPEKGSAAAGKSFGARLKGLFFAESEAAATNIANKTNAALNAEKAALVETDNIVATALEKKLLPGADAKAVLGEIKALTPEKFAELKTNISTLAEAESFAGNAAEIQAAEKALGRTLDPAAIKGMDAAQFTALQNEIAHAQKLAKLVAADAASPTRVAAGKLFPGVEVGKLNPAQVAQLEAVQQAGLLETAALQVKNIAGKEASVPASLLESVQTHVSKSITAQDIAGLSAEQLALLLAERDIAIRAANAPSFLARVTNSDVWRSTFGRIDGAPNQFTNTRTVDGVATVTEFNTFTGNGAAPVAGVRRIIGTTAGNVFRGDDPGMNFVE